MTLPIGNALDLLSGHGGYNEETKSTWSNLTLTPAKLKLVATFIEQRGVKDGLELVGHHGKLLSIHPTLLCWITEVHDLDGSYLKSSVFPHLTQSKTSPKFLSTYVWWWHSQPDACYYCGITLEQYLGIRDFILS